MLPPSLKARRRQGWSQRGGRGKAGPRSTAEAGRNLGKAERVREDSAASPAAPGTCPRPAHSSDGARNGFASQVFDPGLRLADRRQAHSSKALFRRVGLERCKGNFKS